MFWGKEKGKNLKNYKIVHSINSKWCIVEAEYKYKQWNENKTQLRLCFSQEPIIIGCFIIFAGIIKKDNPKGRKIIDVAMALDLERYGLLYIIFPHLCVLFFNFNP